MGTVEPQTSLREGGKKVQVRRRVREDGDRSWSVVLYRQKKEPQAKECKRKRKGKGLFPGATSRNWHC